MFGPSFRLRWAFAEETELTASGEDQSCLPRGFDMHAGNLPSLLPAKILQVCDSPLRHVRRGWAALAGSSQLIWSAATATMIDGPSASSPADR
jgi:hypothetical protein